jgi:hypothetical protein
MIDAFFEMLIGEQSFEVSSECSGRKMHTLQLTSIAI